MDVGELRGVVMGLGETFCAVFVVFGLGFLVLVRRLLKPPIDALADLVAQIGTDRATSASRRGVTGYRELRPLLKTLADLDARVAKLQASEARLRMIFHSVNDAIFIHDVSGAILDVNDRMCSMFGCSREEATTLTVGELSAGSPPFSQEDALGWLAQSRAGKQPIFEWRCRRRDGELFWGEVSMRQATTSGDGRILATVRDITERKCTESALQESEARYRALFLAAGDAIFMMHDGLFIDCNPKTLAMFGCRREDIVGRRPAEFSPLLQPDGRESSVEAERRIRTALTGVSASFEWRHTRLDGTEFDAEVSLTRVDIAGGPFLQAIVRDVTDRKRAETLLARERRFFQALFEALPGEAYVLDGDGRYIRVNRNFEDAHGPGWAGTSFLHEIEILPPAQQILAREALARAFEGGRGSVEHVSLGPDDAAVHRLSTYQGFVLDGQPYAVGVSLDISERVRAEAALRASEGRLEMALELTHGGAWEVDFSTGRVELDPVLLRRLGYPPGTSPTTMGEWTSRVHPNDRARVSAAIDDARQGGSPIYHTEYRHQRPDGTWAWLEGHGKVVEFAPDGTPKRAVGAHVEITERKLAEATLSERAAFDELMTGVLDRFANCRWSEIREATETALQATAEFLGADHAYVTWLNEDGVTWGVRHEWCAPHVKPQFGVSHHVRVGSQPWTEARLLAGEAVRISTMDDYPAEAAAERQTPDALAGRQSILSVPLRSPDGPVMGVVSVDSHRQAVTWTDEDVARLRVVGDAIAGAIGRAEAGRELERQRALTDAVLDSVPGVFYLYDDVGRLIRWNRNLERVTGRSRDELTRLGVLTQTNEGVDCELGTCLERALAEGGADTEVDVRSRGGATVRFYCTGVPVPILGRRYFTGIGIDISELKRAQEDARRHQQSAIQADKLASIGLMVSGVAHEINNPNNLIMLSADVLRSAWPQLRARLAEAPSSPRAGSAVGLPVPTVEQVGTLIEHIATGAVRIQKIVRSLKDFARADSGELQPGVDLRQVVDTAIMLVHNLIRKATDHFSVVHGEVPPVIGNAQKLEQVLINLLTNACQALPDRTRAVTVRTALRAESGLVAVEVRDEGKGIPPQDLARIFDPFFTTKRDSGGTGLGLSVSYGIIEEHGGKLVFASEVGLGTTATILLPVGGPPPDRKETS